MMKGCRFRPPEAHFVTSVDALIKCSAVFPEGSEAASLRTRRVALCGQSLGKGVLSKMQPFAGSPQAVTLPVSSLFPSCLSSRHAQLPHAGFLSVPLLHHQAAAKTSLCE